jgi:hypothetical protein
MCMYIKKGGVGLREQEWQRCRLSGYTLKRRHIAWLQAVKKSVTIFKIMSCNYIVT